MRGNPPKWACVQETLSDSFLEPTQCCFMGMIRETGLEFCLQDSPSTPHQSFILKIFIGDLLCARLAAGPWGCRSEPVKQGHLGKLHFGGRDFAELGSAVCKTSK